MILIINVENFFFSQNLHYLLVIVLIVTVNFLLLELGGNSSFKLIVNRWPELFCCDSTIISQGNSSLHSHGPRHLKKYLLDFFFFSNQRSIAVTMDLADSLSFVELEELLAVAQHIQHWFL